MRREIKRVSDQFRCQSLALAGRVNGNRPQQQRFFVADPNRPIAYSTCKDAFRVCLLYTSDAADD